MQLTNAVVGSNTAVPPPPEFPIQGVAWHYGDPLGEQRAAATDAVIVDRSNRFVIALTGDDRLTWLHSISSQDIARLADRSSTENLILDANGRIEYHFVLTDVDGTLWLDTDPERGPELLKYLSRMVFWAKVELRHATDQALVTLIGPKIDALGLELPSGVNAATVPTGTTFARRRSWPEYSVDVLMPRDSAAALSQELVDRGAVPAGSWTYEAIRVSSLRARIGIDTDERTIPHEVDLIGGPEEFGAVHLNKGCYRGQETVARVHNLGKPPRRLVLLQLDGSAESRPSTGATITLAEGGRTVGRLGTVVDHYELGPIALGLIKRGLGQSTQLTVDGAAAAIDPTSFADDDRVQPGRIAVERWRSGQKNF